MIGIDRQTGKRVTDYDQLVSRVIQVMTTPLGGRIKRSKFGSNVRQYLSANMSDIMLVKLQSAALEAFHNTENGLQDFNVDRCVASRHETGLNLYFSGIWQGRKINFEVPIDVSA